MLGIHIAVAVAWQRAAGGDWAASAAEISRRSARKERTSQVSAPVEIADYDPGWPAAFAALRDQITGVLGPLAQRIEHVGSTAVPGLPAKPIIDLDVVIATRAHLPEVITRLDALGYHHEGDLGITGREAFTSPAATPAHHLYVCSADSRELTLDTSDAAEIAETLTFLAGRLSGSQKRILAGSFAAFADHPTYGIEALRADLHRFAFLLGASDGEELFGEQTS